MKRLKNPYLITTLCTVLIFLVLFIGKGIYPFGNHTLIFGDMHDQITAFYYHFYDVFHGNASLMIDFSTSGGINFIGILAYYILSPFSLILLFFPREDLYLAVSIVIALKVLASALTCLYSIQVLGKKKCPFLLSAILALSYAFSGYSLILYQITPWMDAMYLFPLVLVGLKKVLDLEKPYLYIVSLTLSIVFSFYVSYMSLIFIFFLSFIYIFVYKDKKEWKKSIVALGISTVFAIGLSMFITLPSLLEITESSRLGFSLADVLNSKTGPLTDKISYFLPTAFLLVTVGLLLLDFRNHKKFLKWYFPSLLILGIPYIIEPVNKIFHFFSYAFFPNRYGYMMFYFLVLGALYYFTNASSHKEVRHRKLISVSMTLLCSSAAVILTVLYYEVFQDGVFKLTISKDNRLIFVVLFMCIAIMIGIVSAIYANRSSKMYGYILVLTMVHLTCNVYLYMGLGQYQESLIQPYQAMEEIRKTHQGGDFYRLKTNTSSLITNNGMVTGYFNLDHFTSLVNGRNLHTLKQFGYNSHWTKTYSKNGTLFADSLLANQYYLTANSLGEDWYEKIYSLEDYNLYRLKEDLSYGYFTDDIDFLEEEHTFDFQNRIYRALTGKNKDLFTIYRDFQVTNLDVLEKEGRTLFQIVDEEGTNYLEMNIPVGKRSAVYLEIFNSFVNTEDDAIYKRMKIYVNDQLYKSSYPIPTNNGSLMLGTFEEEVVNVKVEFRYDTELSYIEVGVLPKEEMISFVRDEKVQSSVRFSRNKIFVDVDSDEGGLFFIPVAYSKGYEAKVQGKVVPVEKVYDNFLGVKLEKGKSNIEFTFTSPGLKSGCLVSLATLFIMALGFRFQWYQKLVAHEKFGKFVEIVYLFLYFLALFLIYLVPTVCFFLSYFFYIS